MHWGWYWKIKKNHTPKASCDQFLCLDSFKTLNNDSFTGFNIKAHALEAILEKDSLLITFSRGSYRIFFEKQECHFGGYRHFFFCPKCNKRMRKLYCCHGAFFCRQCLNLGYRNQREWPSIRLNDMKDKIKNSLEAAGGSLYKKPKWMRWHTYEKLVRRYRSYEEKANEAFFDDSFKIFG